MSNVKTSTFFTDKDYESAYNNKLENCKRRLISLKLSKEEYIALLKARTQFKCFYTGIDFVLGKGSDHPDYPTLERIDNTKGYEEGNVVLCANKVNSLKNSYIECNKSRKGLPQKDLMILTRIEKSMNMKVGWNEELAKYSEVFRKAREVVEAKKIKSENEMVKMLKDEVLKRQNLEIELTTSFAETCKMFEGFGKVLGITFKEWRDINRRTKCTISGLPLDKSNKTLFVKDKSLDIITKKDVILVHVDIQKGLDYMTKGDKSLVKSLVHNVSKISK